MLGILVLFLAPFAIQAGTLPPKPVTLLPPSPVPGCLDTAEVPSTGILETFLQRSGAFMVMPEAGAVIALKVDSSSGRCRVRAELQLEEVTLESQRLAPTGQKASDTARFAAVLEELAATWYQKKAGKLEINSVPTGLPVTLDGVPAGNTPARLEHLVPGPTVIRIAGPGWVDLLDTLRIEAGTSLRRDLALRRTAAWLDSVHRAEVAQRRDSLWTQARQTPGQALPELFARLANIAVPAGRQSVAILPFQTSGKTSGEYDPGRMAAEYGVAHFSRDPRYQVVERTGMNHLLQEQALIQSGAINDSGAAVAGRMVAANYLVGGTVTVDGSKQTFSARMISVETGEVVSAAIAVVGQDKLEDLYRTAIGERGQLSGSLYRSAVGPGWGQFYTNHPVHGGVALGAVVLAAGWSVVCWTDYLDKDNTLRKFRNGDPSTAVAGELPDAWLARANAARTTRNDASSAFGWSLGILGAAWAGNLIDAGVLGWEESRRIRAQYFAWMPSTEIGPQAIRLSWGF